MTLPESNGFGHIDLTVTDVERSVRWWEDVLGCKAGGEARHARLHVVERVQVELWAFDWNLIQLRP